MTNNINDIWTSVVLNHPEVKKLIESGDWDRLTPYSQRSFASELLPMSKDLSEFLAKNEFLPETHDLEPPK
ncbi:MAG: hypothetical protein LBT38_04820 [Deltaproteobacteria bacterium]|jgi:hypothetical protein|nr:hypothetical protein [Deltaproteobacteria bacterium]